MRQTTKIILMVLCLDNTPHCALPSLTGSIDESVKHFRVSLWIARPVKRTGSQISFVKEQVDPVHPLPPTLGGANHVLRHSCNCCQLNSKIQNKLYFNHSCPLVHINSGSHMLCITAHYDHKHSCVLKLCRYIRALVVIEFIKLISLKLFMKLCLILWELQGEQLRII